ncbi:MAG: sensor histidine kinase, partial [Bacteroidota bacterium]|nr:sensor histidine kinase [Bacteroidota bacterium]
LLSLQTNKAKDDFHKNLLQESRNRLESISTIHQLLYQSKSYATVNFKEYLEKILSNLNNSFSSSDKKIKTIKNIQTIELEISVAIPLALIVNELVTNSYKHAFQNVAEGIIEITLTESAGKVFLQIRDNGPGFSTTKATESSIGLDIIKGLVNQIDGEMGHRNDAGSVSSISFDKA